MESLILKNKKHYPGNLKRHQFKHHFPLVKDGACYHVDIENISLFFSLSLGVLHFHMRVMQTVAVCDPSGCHGNLREACKIIS